MKGIGLRAKLAVVLGGIAILAFGLIYFASIRLTTSMLMEDEVRVITQTGDVLVPLLLRLAQEQSDVDLALRNASQGGGLETVQVLNEQLETISPRGCTPAEVLVGRTRLVKLARSPEAVTLVRSPSSGRLFASARPMPGGGYLFAARSSVYFDSKRKSLLSLLIMWGAVLFLAIGLATSILLRNIVTRPIFRLVEEAAEVASGGQPLTPKRLDSDEFGILRGSLVSMAERLQRDRNRIQSQVEELERVNRDLTEAHDQLVRTEKLASVGQLAAGVAHEIGNPISIILAHLDLLALDNLTKDQLDTIGRLRKATERIDSTLRNLMDFSRPATDEETHCHVRSTSQEVLELVAPQKRFKMLDVKLENRVAGADGVLIPPSRYKQVLLNLLMNAADAMAGKGAIFLTLEPAGEASIALSVGDTGPGISQDDYLRIFDPFYTTKEVGKGTGLGLFVCHTIVSRYGGEIAVTSEEGEGAVFTVILPREPRNGA
jgi:two-component system, NtrC family, sensor kinase